jgi:hypothetical protein
MIFKHQTSEARMMLARLVLSLASLAASVKKNAKTTKHHCDQPDQQTSLFQ